jgi:hypothetical protein
MGNSVFHCTHRPQLTPSPPFSSLVCKVATHRKCEAKVGIPILPDGGRVPFSSPDGLLQPHWHLPPTSSPDITGEPLLGGRGFCAGPFKNHPTPPREGWPRRVDSETAFVLVLCPGCSWQEDGGGGEEEKEEEEGWGGWGGTSISETGQRMGCAFPLGKGPQDAWVGLVLGPGKTGPFQMQVVDSIQVHWGPKTAPSLRRFPGPPKYRGVVPGPPSWLEEQCAQGRGLLVKGASVCPWPWPACLTLYITPVLLLDEWGSVWAGG